MTGWLERSALVALLALGVGAGGCGADEEPTTIDLSGLITVEDLSDELPVTEEALQAAIARNIQERAPSDVEVVYSAGGGDEEETPADAPEDAVDPEVDICPFLPYLCTYTDLSDILVESTNEAAEESGEPPGGLVKVDPVPALPPGGLVNEDPIPAEQFGLSGLFIPAATLGIAGLEAKVFYNEDNSAIATTVDANSPIEIDVENVENVDEGTTTETDVPTDTAPAEPEPVEPEAVEPEAVEPAPVEPAPVEPESTP
jgi:hypothetical protein